MKTLIIIKEKLKEKNIELEDNIINVYLQKIRNEKYIKYIEYLKFVYNEKINYKIINKEIIKNFYYINKIIINPDKDRI